VLGSLLESLPEVLAAEVLPRLDPADRAVLAQVGRPWLAAVVASGLACAGKTAGVPLTINAVVGSAERLAWSKANGCPWVVKVCELAAQSGCLAALRWARANDCPWDELTCASAARAGRLEVLQWLREHHCPWSASTCAHAAGAGHLEVLQWAMENGCPWREASLCRIAAQGGHLEVLQWLRRQNCPWSDWVHWQLGVGTWTCFSGRARTAAR